MDAQRALQADLLSISTPVSLINPSHLRIILSTDHEAEKVVGKEIPITASIAGWVFQRQQPSFKNPTEKDSKHYDLIDKAAGTKTGEGAILTVPLVSGKLCRGVIQFMKTNNGWFGESDVLLATRLIPTIVKLVVAMEDTKEADIPVVAYGDIKIVAVMFTDITSYTAIAKKIRIQDSAALLNEYFSRLLPFAIKNGGKLEEYLGDGMYLTFSHERPSASALAAIKTASEMQSEYLNLLSGWRQYQQPVSDANFHRIGIAIGDIYSGYMGPPQERRSKHVGQAVNLAAHLCEEVKAVRKNVAICPQTYDFIKGEWTNFNRCVLSQQEAWTADL